MTSGRFPARCWRGRIGHQRPLATRLGFPSKDRPGRPVYGGELAPRLGSTRPEAGGAKIGRTDFESDRFGLVPKLNLTLDTTKVVVLAGAWDRCQRERNASSLPTKAKPLAEIDYPFLGWRKNLGYLDAAMGRYGYDDLIACRDMKPFENYRRDREEAARLDSRSNPHVPHCFSSDE